MTLVSSSSCVSDPATSGQSTEQFGVHWSLEQALRFSEQCYDRDALFDTLLGFSQRCLSNRMILLLGNRQAKPYRLRGWPELSERFRERDALMKINVSVASNVPFFDEAQPQEDSLSYALAPRPEDIGIAQLFVELTLFPPERVVFETVRIGQYPAVALLGEPLKEATLKDRRELQICARAIGAQLSEILRLTRIDQLPQPEARVPTAPLPAPEHGEAPHPGSPVLGLPFADSTGEDEPPPPTTAQTTPKTLTEKAKRRTMEGGFTVNPLTLETGADKEEHHFEPETPSNPQEESAPRAQILRPVSLKKGRKTGNFQAASKIPLEEEAPQFEPEQTTPKGPEDELLKRFPGELRVDRYKFTISTLPPVEAHGPMLAELVENTERGVEVAKELLDHTSIEVRFYATYLFSKLPVEQAIEPMLERLFDRDLQTRQCAKQIILAHHHRRRARGEDWLGEQLRPFLHATLANEEVEDIRVEIAAELLGAIRDAQSVELLFESLDRLQTRVKDNVYDALQAITYLELEPTTAAWRRWREAHPRGAKTNAEERGEWILNALNAPSLQIRERVFEEIGRFERLDLNYHPNQPEKLRIRAQEDMGHWLTLYPPK